MPSFLELRGQYGKVKLNKVVISYVRELRTDSLIEKDVVCDVRVFGIFEIIVYFLKMY